MGIHSLQVRGIGRYYSQGQSIKKHINLQGAKFQFEFDTVDKVFFVKFFALNKPLPDIKHRLSELDKSIEKFSLERYENHNKGTNHWLLTIRFGDLTITFQQDYPKDELRQLGQKIRKLRGMPSEQAVALASSESFWKFEPRSPSFTVTGEGKHGTFGMLNKRALVEGWLTVEVSSEDKKWHIKFMLVNGIDIDHTLDEPGKSMRIGNNFWDLYNSRQLLLVLLSNKLSIAFYPHPSNDSYQLAKVLEKLSLCSNYASVINSLHVEGNWSPKMNGRANGRGYENGSSCLYGRQNGAKWHNGNTTPYRCGNQRYDGRNIRHEGYQRNVGYRRSLPLNDSPRRNKYNGMSLNRSLTYSKGNRRLSSSADKENRIDLADSTSVRRSIEGDEGGYDTGSDSESVSKSPASSAAESSTQVTPSMDASSPGGFYGKGAQSRRDYLSESKSKDLPSPSISSNKRSLATPLNNQNKKIRTLSSPGTPNSRTSSTLSGPFFMMGFENTGNSCYINAVLQMLLNSHYFVRSLKELRKIPELGFETTSLLRLLCAISDHRSEIDSAALESRRSTWAATRKQLLVDLRAKMTTFNKNYESAQQDCQEFLDQLLEKLKEEICNLMKIKECPVDTVSEYFSFTIKETLVCQRCNNTSYPKEDYYALSLTLSEPSNRLHLTKLMSANFDNDEREYSCQRDGCTHNKSNATRKVVRVPQILIVHLKRVIFHEGQMKKDTKPVSFPKHISLNDWCDLEGENETQQVDVSKPIFPILENPMQRRPFHMNDRPSSPANDYVQFACREQAVNSNSLMSQSAIPCMVGCGLNGGYLQQSTHSLPEVFGSPDLDPPIVNGFEGNDAIYPTTKEEEENQMNAAVACSLEDDNELRQAQERSLREYNEQQSKNEHQSDGDEDFDEEEVFYEQHPESLPYSYRLTGVICHDGSPQCGHYTAAIYSFKHGKWLLCNDDEVKETSEEDVFRRHRKQACVFFYLRNEIFQQTESAFGKEVTNTEVGDTERPEPSETRKSV